MKRCLSCGCRFANADWRCPSCHAAPAIIDGFPAFAPSLSDGSDAFVPEAHESLDGLQDASFWFRARNRLVADLVSRFAPDARAVLEIGCGTGYVLATLRETLPQARLTGSEVDANALSFAKSRLGNGVEFIQMDGRAVPFVEEFDLICAFDVLEHIEEDKIALAEIHRALKAGGAALLAVPQHPLLWSWLDEYGKHKRRYRRRELADKCRRAALTVVFETSFVTSLLPLMAASRFLSRFRTDRRPAAELMLPRWLDRLCEAMLESERIAIRAGMRFPVGGSRFVLARRFAEVG